VIARRNRQSAIGNRQSMTHLPPEIGNYRLERPIGRGATSEVWLARHSLLGDRQVALKLLIVHDAESVRRFQREAQLAGRLRHPNIVQLYDYGTIRSGHSHVTHYSVIEYIDGGSLRQLLEKQHQLPLNEAATIFRQIAAALDYAHGHGIVHRDVSPGNVLIEQESGRALLCDFGIARDPARSITVTTSIMGTPGYWAPEQAQSAKLVTHLSDIYSLGALLYTMLTGQLPWDDPPGPPENQFSPPIPLKERGLDNLPDDVDRILRTLLAVDPAKRYPSATAAALELEQVVNRHQMPTQIVGETPRAVGFHFESSGIEANEVEKILGPDLIRAPIERAHERAAALRDPATVAALLDSWSSADRLRLRLPLLGRMARLHKASSRNIYFFRLCVLYERRTPPETSYEPDRKEEVFPLVRELDRWDVVLSPADKFVDEAGGRVVIPGSMRVVSCTSCKGNGSTVCPRCNGKQRIYVTRPAPELAPTTPKPVTPARSAAVAGSSSVASTAARTSPAPSSASTAAPAAAKVLVPCPDCNGRGGITCTRCQGVGRLVERKTFRWSRQQAELSDNDDLPRVDEDWLSRTCEAAQIYQERHRAGLRPDWSLVPTLSILVDSARQRLDADTRIVLSEVTVSFIPITEIVFDLGHVNEKRSDGGLYRLAIYGFENLIPPDWRLFDWERVISICLVGFLLILTAIFGFFAFSAA
jgi:serine/threonine protein kinase